MIALLLAVAGFVLADGQTAYTRLGYAQDNATAIPRATSFTFRHTPAALEISLTAACADARAAAAKAGDPWSCGECFEIFLTPPGRRYQQFAVGANGSRWDSRRPKAAADDSWQADVAVTAAGYAAKVRLPWSVFGVAPAQIGDTWRVNVCRMFVAESGKPVSATFAPVGATFRNFEQFATLRFGSAGEIAARDAAVRDAGVAKLRGELARRGLKGDCAEKLAAVEKGGDLRLLDELAEELKVVDALAACPPAPPVTIRRFTLRPTPSSEIRCILALPEKANWNGRFVGLGNGGKAGHVYESSVRSYALNGYAAAQTDMGTSGGITNVEQLVDFGSRATHLMTVEAKRLIAEAYGAAPTFSYFFGESTGGGQGIHEAMRYPEDYDGIVAGVPANARMRTHLYFLRNYPLARYASGRPDITREEFAFTDEQAEVVAWAGRRHEGERATPVRIADVLAEAARMDPTLDDPELRRRLTAYFENGLPFGANLFHGSGNQWLADWRFGPTRDLATVTETECAAWAREWGPHLDALPANLDAFAAHGGKLLVYAGTADGCIPWTFVADWFDGLGNPSCARLLLLKGRAHGSAAYPGGANNLDWLKEISSWREKGGADAGRKVTSLSGGGWTLDGQPVTVPHTWNAVDGCDGGVNSNGTFTSCRASSYVRKAATYRRALPDPTGGKRQFVKCEAVSIKAIVRVNGREVGRHRGAFTAFCFEVTDFLKPTGNVLEIVADNTLDEEIPPIVGDFTMYGGLYRDVWFVETDPVCIDLVTDGADGVVLEPDAATGDVVAHVAVLGGTNETQRFHFDRPKLWSPETPHVYEVTVRIAQKGSTDAVTVPFGFRTLRFDDTGFYLNGVRRQFRGACRHQDREGKGWAVTHADETDDVRMMKRMGCDAIRTSHYPQSTAFLDACDRLGLMVWSETALVNEVTFSEAFRESMLAQAREMIAQRRNHPSIVLWGLFNEIYSGSKRADGTIEVYLRELRDQMHRQDPTRKVVCASNQYGRRELNQVSDFCGFNIYAGWYEYPPWYGRRLDRTGAMTRTFIDLLCRTNGLVSLGIGEYGAGGSVFRHNDPFKVLPYDDRDDSEEYQAAFHYCNYGALRDDSRVWGTFIWEMFDSGADVQHEPGRWGCNTKGLVEFDHRTPKDAFYFYKANWNPEPMLHLVGSRRGLAHGLTTTVFGFSNAGDVTLAVNGRVIGTKTPDDRKAVLWDDVALSPGDNEIVLTCGALRARATLRAPTTVRIARETSDAPAAFRAALARLGAAGGTIVFEPGEYRIPCSAGTEMKFFVSNHDQRDVHRVLFPIVGMTNVTVEASGALFVYDGTPIPFVVRDSADVTLRGFGIDSSIPFMPELTITGFDGAKTRARLDAEKSPHYVKDGRLHFTGADWDFTATHAKLFDGRTRELVERSGDIPYAGACRELPSGELELAYDFAHRGKGAQVGDVVVLRPGPRPSPAVFVSRARNVLLEDVAVHSALGMALLAQRSKNVTWRGTGGPESRRAGVFARAATGRYASAHADATHFSNVAGEARVENCLFESMMDDAMNVHSTCLFITNVLSRTEIRCRYMHPQSVGFEVFRPYELLRVIDGDTLEPQEALLKVSGVRTLSAEEVVLSLAEPLPDGFGAGDAVENADYQCAATFRGNIVRFNRARGTLFTTPKPVLVESNLFDRVSGSAILFSGDAHYWFESGACRDVAIRGNVFRNCLTSYGSHGFCNGIVSVCPVVHRIDAQKACYHRNIRIEDNVFETFDVPLVYGYSVDGLDFRRNKVIRNKLYRGLGKPPFLFDHCRNVKTAPGG